MASVEKDGMKLYEKLGLIGGGESARLQDSVDDFGTHGSYLSGRSLSTLTLGH